jgi:hypothetical protein
MTENLHMGIEGAFPFQLIKYDILVGVYLTGIPPLK